MAEPIRIDEPGFRPSYRPQKAPSGLDPDMKRMGLVAVGLGGALALLAGGAMLMRPAHHGVPVIEAEAGPVRIKPANPGGMQVSGADLNSAGIGQGPHLAPAAERPELATLRAEVRDIKQREKKLLADNEALAKQSAEADRVAHLAEATASHPKVVAAPAPVARATATARVAAAPEVSPPVPAVSVTTVQLAAFVDEAAARHEWEALTQRVPDLLGNKRPEISRADAGGRVMFRLRTGGFNTVADAVGFCAKMKAHGESCSIAAF
jgi:hypothetical protein